MKEVRIKLDEDRHEQLKKAAARDLRSISNQVILYIQQGLEKSGESTE